MQTPTQRETRHNPIRRLRHSDLRAEDPRRDGNNHEFIAECSSRSGSKWVSPVKAGGIPDRYWEYVILASADGGTTWDQVDLVFNEIVSAVSATDRIVIVGSVPNAEFDLQRCERIAAADDEDIPDGVCDEYRAGLWISTDGINWQHQGIVDPLVGWFVTVGPQLVHTDDLGFIGVGCPTLLVSADGLRWESKWGWNAADFRPEHYYPCFGYGSRFLASGDTIIGHSPTQGYVESGPELWRWTRD